MKKTCLILTTILFSYTASAQTDVQNNLLRFPNGGNPTPTYLQEGWGINIYGTGIQPVKVVNTSLMVGYTSANQDFGVGNALISGRVGIGTTSPASQLHIIGSDVAGGMVNVQNTSSNQFSGMNMFTESGQLAASFQYGNSATGGLSNTFFLGNRSGGSTVIVSGPSADPKFTVLNGGNVGIGTTAPTAKLDVNGGIAVQHFGYVASQRSSNNNYTNLFLGGAIKDNGNGTFTVLGDGGSNYFSAIRMDNGGPNIGGINFYTGTTTAGSEYSLSNADLVGYMKMTIVGNSVGIGTSLPDPAYKLSVNGSIRGKEVKVETGWADYVFKKGYRLKPLHEVEAFIAKQGHLPEVPSEAEVKKEGINVGETESLLLKKIEELTLYLIEKDGEVKAQQAQLKSQVSLIKSQSRKNKLLEARLARVEVMLLVGKQR